MWSWEHSTQKYSFYRHLWSFVIAFLYSNSPTSWLRSIIVKPKMVPVGPAGLDRSYLELVLMLIWQDERSDCQDWGHYNTLLYTVDSLKLTSTQIVEWRCWKRWEIPSHHITEDWGHSTPSPVLLKLSVRVWPTKKDCFHSDNIMILWSNIK